MTALAIRVDDALRYSVQQRSVLLFTRMPELGCYGQAQTELSLVVSITSAQSVTVGLDALFSGDGGLLRDLHLVTQRVSQPLVN